MTLKEFKEEMLNEKDYLYIKRILEIDEEIDELEEREGAFYDETIEFEDLYCEKKYICNQLLKNHPELETDGMYFAYSIIHEIKSGILTFNSCSKNWELKKSR